MTGHINFVATATDINLEPTAHEIKTSWEHGNPDYMGVNAFDNIKAKLDNLVTVNYSVSPPEKEDINTSSSNDGGKREKNVEIVTSEEAADSDRKVDDLGNSTFGIVLQKLKQDLGEHLHQERKIKMESFKKNSAFKEDKDIAVSKVTELNVAVAATEDVHTVVLKSE